MYMTELSGRREAMQVAFLRGCRVPGTSVMIATRLVLSYRSRVTMAGTMVRDIRCAVWLPNFGLWNRLDFHRDWFGVWANFTAIPSCVHACRLDLYN